LNECFSTVLDLRQVHTKDDKDKVLKIVLNVMAESTLHLTIMVKPQRNDVPADDEQ